jgi:hypothetical protein
MASGHFIGDDLFGPHPEYPRLLAGAHRRRPVPLGGPALVRHVAFWRPPPPPVMSKGEAGTQGQDEWEKEDPPAITDRAIRADEWIAEIYRNLKRLEEIPGPAPMISKVTSNSEVDVNGVPVVVLFRCAMNRDTGVTRASPVRPDSYRTIKIAFVWRGMPTTLSFELHTEFLTLTGAIDLSCERSPPQIEIDRQRFGPVFASTHDKLMQFENMDGRSLDQCEELHEFVYYEIWNSFSRDILEAARSHTNDLGTKFIDFRGLVLSAAPDKNRVRIRPPFARPDDARDTGKERGPLCRIGEFDKLWSFIRCTQLEDTEFTISRFLGNRAFYATALGSQQRAMLEGVGRPLCYLLYEDTINSWQLGRLIYRIHRAGTARIAAIVHFDELRNANHVLTEVERELETANALLAGAPSQSAATDDGSGFRIELRESYKSVEERLGAISGLQLDGTLESRIERSRYYVKQFTSATDGLRIRRVSGFQRYDEFVLQRLGPVFAYIDSLGRRYTRVQNDRVILLGRIQSYDAQFNQETVARAQRLADLALSCVLIPYYGGYVISHAIPDILAEDGWIWTAAFLFGSIMFLFLKWDYLFGANPPRFLATLPSRYLTALLLSIFITVPIALAVPHLQDAQPQAETNENHLGGSQTTPVAH